MTLRPKLMKMFNEKCGLIYSKFLPRFGEYPDFTDKKILDVGCGLGSLCVVMGLSGAAKVVGIDINEKKISFAQENLDLNYADLATIVEFKKCDISALPEDSSFDIIFSKDSFEHILDVEKTLSDIGKVLKPGGLAYIGFGPLYFTPYADHLLLRKYLSSWGLAGRFVSSIPWAHLYFEDYIVKRHNDGHQKKASSIKDLGLNMKRASEFKTIFFQSELKVVDFRVNQSNSSKSKLISLFRHIPFLSDYCTHNIYCILQRI